jgi:ABC-type multidrug transport system ATPase subunit
VGQSPFIMNGSARENILFGSSLEPQRYAAVLQATLLEAFDDGRILDSGVVSGGEAARISLARALYSRSRVLIVDDILGSLDTKTRKCVVRSLLEEVVNKGRTVIIVTRVEAIISSAHVVLQIEDGVVTQSRQNVVLGVVDSDERRDVHEKTEELIGNGIDCTPVVERRGIEESHVSSDCAGLPGGHIGEKFCLRHGRFAGCISAPPKNSWPHHQLAVFSFRLLCKGRAIEQIGC